MRFPTIEEVGEAYNHVTASGIASVETMRLCGTILENPLLLGTVERYVGILRREEIFRKDEPSQLAFVAGVLALGMNYGLRIAEQRDADNAEAWRLLDLVAAEFQSDPQSVQCFDLRIVQEAIELIKKRRAK